MGGSETSSTTDTESEVTPDTSLVDSEARSDSSESSDSPPSKIDTEPTLADLSQFTTKNGETIKIILSLAPKWQEFATELDFDNDGRQLQLFESDHHNAMKTCRKVLMYWLAGNGKQPSTWRTLISLLRSPSVGEGKLAWKLKTDLL